jgi:hypothetical protein
MTPRSLEYYGFEAVGEYKPWNYNISRSKTVIRRGSDVRVTKPYQGGSTPTDMILD